MLATQIPSFRKKTDPSPFPRRRREIRLDSEVGAQRADLPFDLTFDPRDQG